MNGKQQIPIATIPDELVAGFFTHLDNEENALRETIQALHEVRGAIMKRDMEALAQALNQQQQLANKNASQAQARNAVRHRLAAILQVNVDYVNLSLLAQRTTPTMREQLFGRQRRLVELATEADLLNRANAALIRQSIDLLQQVLTCLTGESGTDSYNASGQIQSGDFESTVQTSC
jgi:flagellar biosynthesis/type III secretory pathway chaperone